VAYHRFKTGLSPFFAHPKALTLQTPASIRAAMAAGAIPPPRFFEHCRASTNKPLARDCLLPPQLEDANRLTQQRRSFGQYNERPARLSAIEAKRHPLEEFETMANTKSAKKATRKIARRTVINKSRRTEMRSAVRNVEEAIKRGDRDAALKAMTRAEPELMRAGQRNIIHKNNASRKVSRLSHQIAKLAAAK
jgi:small subunit ribosomal protein S20